MSLTLHLESGGRSARVALHGLPTDKPKLNLRTLTRVGEVGNRRLVSGARRSSEGLDYASLIAGDPELDLTLAGHEIDSDSVSPAWFDASAEIPVPIGDFADVDVVYDAQGVEKTRRPHLVRRSNLNDLHPVRLGKRLPVDEALAAFAFKQSLQVAHVDGLTFEFLRELARDLASKKDVAVLGAGPKGNLPLVLRESGTAYRAFLYGELDEQGRYKLLLLLSDQELKLPEASTQGAGA
ncbi:MAG: hypothetical protein KDI60_13135 [Xanthomonadales bacterium]|nr:hypothetical protein [Xanthomonadales bacterium]